MSRLPNKPLGRELPRGLMNSSNYAPPIDNEIRSRVNYLPGSLQNRGIMNSSNVDGVLPSLQGGGISKFSNAPSAFPGRVLGNTRQPAHFPRSQEQGNKPYVAEGYYSLCRSLVIQVLTNGSGKRLETELKGDEAKYMTDLLSEILDDKEVSLSRYDRKYMLNLLFKLARTAQVFPQSLELQNVQCNLGKHVTIGGFGQIYRGLYEGKSVCVKAVHVSEAGLDKNEIRAHAGELILLAHLSHQNILPLFGIFFSEEQHSRVCIVSPWMENGDLLQYTKAFPNASLKPLLYDMISGLKFLHDFDVVHADLKAKNVLISETGRAMLADFGISRVAMTSATTTTNNPHGTPNWTAPEIYINDSIPNRESDIWAFGCVCYEMVTGKTPFNQYKVASHLISAFLKGSPIPEKPTQHGGWDGTKEVIWTVAERCWKHDPKSRPTSGELHNLIEGFGISEATDRPQEPRYSRPKVQQRTDYFHIFDILRQFRNSPRGPSGTSAKTRTSAFEEELIHQLIETQRQAQNLYSENEDLRMHVEQSKDLQARIKELEVLEARERKMRKELLEQRDALEERLRENESEWHEEREKLQQRVKALEQEQNEWEEKEEREMKEREARR